MKTCTKCSAAKVEAEFSRRGTGRSSWCKACVRTATKARREANPDAARDDERRRSARRYSKASGRINERVRSRYRVEQDMTLATATNRGKKWTGPELELVADQKRTAKDVALALGRTVQAVKDQRHLLRTDPRKARMAGTEVAR